MTKLHDFVNGRSMAELYDTYWVPAALDDIARVLDGKEVRMSGMTADVVRRQADGSWLMVIDNPFGGSQVLSENAAL